MTRKSLVAIWRDAVRDDDQLNSTARLVAFVLSTYVNGSGLAYPSRGTLAAGAGLSTGLRAVDRALSSLELAGFLAIERSRGRSSHRYTLTLPATAHEVRRSEWSTAHEATRNRAPGTSNRARGAPESGESAESGAPTRGRLEGAALRAIDEECEKCGR